MKYLLLSGLLASCAALKPPSTAQLIAGQQAAGQQLATKLAGIYDAPSLIRNDSPLVFINGRKSSASQLKYLAPNTIDSIRIIKPAVSTAIYGKRGRDGVILLTTKKKQHG
jgi:TonB-dependent SusC/RagA subfamily outer membrane receptor